MNGSTAYPEELQDLVVALIDGEINSEEHSRLSALLRDSAEARQCYLLQVTLHVKLQKKIAHLTASGDCRQTGVCPDFRGHRGEAVVDENGTVPFDTVELGRSASSPTLGFLGEAWHGTVGYFSQVGPLSYLIAMFIMLVMGVVAWSWKLPDNTQIASSKSGTGSLFQNGPKGAHLPSIVGRITGMVDCRWEKWSVVSGQGSEEVVSGQGSAVSVNKSSSHQSLSTNHYPLSTVSLGDKFALASGLMEITYDSGAKVILQGPVTYEVESATGGYLAVGRLTARVEKKETNLPSPSGRGAGGEGGESSLHPSSFILHPLFAVRTPTAVVTDLGTEFGVEVSKEGRTTSHVFRGVVVVQAMATKGALADEKRVLHENETVMVEEGDVKRIVVPAASDELPRFVREIPKPITKKLDLVDVVAGGDGFSGKRDRGIDPTNGQRCDTPPASKDFLFMGDGQYHRVEGMPFVDGVFIPDWHTGPVQIDSAGHTFVGFTKRTGPLPLTSGYIWAGGVIHVPPSNDLLYLPVVLDNVDYTSSSHGVLCMHANKGITFDLDAVRSANPAWKIVRFCAVAANVAVTPEIAGLADIWVCVDGRSRFQRREINRSNSAFSVVVPISKNDRFLTLMGTDGGDGIGWDWVVFGDPRLDLVQTNVDPR